jgi:hypothetical protein
MQFVGLLLLLLGAGLFVLIYGMRIKARQTERLANLYQQAIEKGVDPRTLQFQFEERELGDPQGNLKAGIILLAVALAILLGIWAADRLPGAYRAAGFACVPALTGLACLFIHYAVPRPGPKG